MLAVTGSNYVITSALIDASEARVSGEMNLNAQIASTENTQLSEKFTGLSIEIKDIVQQGLEARTDEVLIALTRLSSSTDQITLKMANIPVGGALYGSFVEFAQVEGNFGSLYQVGDIAFGSVRLTSLNDSKAIALQEIVNLASAEDLSNLRLQFEISPDALWTDSSVLEQSILDEMTTLQEALDLIK